MRTEHANALWVTVKKILPVEKSMTVFTFELESKCKFGTLKIDPDRIESYSKPYCQQLFQRNISDDHTQVY